MTVSINNFRASTEQVLAPDQVAGLIAQARQAAGYSIDDLAVTTGLVTDEIVGMENGTDFDPAKLKRIANALKMPMSVLEAS